MKIVVHTEDGKEITFENITDYYLAVRTLAPRLNAEQQILYESEVRSYSAGTHIRELIKELAQSVVELQDILRSYPAPVNDKSVSVEQEAVN